MSKWKRRGLQLLGLVGILVAMYAVMQIDDPDQAAVLVVAGATLGGAAMALSIHLDHDEQYDERQLLIRYRAGYLAFFALFWFLLPLTMGAIDNEEATHRIPMTADEVVFLAYGFGFAVFAAAFLYYRRTI